MFYITNDKGYGLQSITSNLISNNRKFQLVLLDDYKEENSNVNLASILLPPNSVLYRYVETNDFATFRYQYLEYLSTFEVREYIAILMYGTMYCNTDIVLILGNNYGLYFNVLAEYLFYNYGISIPQSGALIEFNPNPLQKHYINTELVQFGLLRPQEFNEIYKAPTPQNPFKVLQ